jgi:hypothetical protein
MTPTTSNQPDQYLVHHQGQIQGPFGVDFIEAMVISGVYPSSVVVERPNTSVRLPFSELMAVADFELPSRNSPQSKKTKPETVVAWIAGAFGVCVLLWIINLFTSSKKPESSSSNARTDWSNPRPAHNQVESGSPTSAGTNHSPSTSKSSYAPTRVSPTPQARASSKPGSYMPADDSKIYRDASGRSYRVSSADYNRLVVMKSALTPKSDRIDRYKQERQALSSQLESDRITLDQTSQYAVDSFNSKINRLNAMNGPLQNLVDDFNRDVDAFNAELARVGTLTY